MIGKSNGGWKKLALVLGCAGLIACQEATRADTDAVVEEARSLFEQRKFSEALAMMRDLAEANPDDAKIQSLYGEALIASGQPSLAVWPLARAMREPEEIVHAGILLARAQGESGSGADAIKTATRVLEVDPDNQQALLLRVQAYLGESLEERALADLDRAEELGSEKTELDLLRLDALLGLGREKEAEDLLAKLSKEADEMRDDNPAQSARMCAATATFTFERGDVEGAKERFSECLEGDGVLQWMLVEKAANFFDEHGEIERSTEILKRRFDHDQEDLGNRALYADRLQKVGRFEEGEALLLAATEKQKAAWTALADLYAIKGDVRKALDALEKAIAASPKRHEDWLFSKADFQLELGEISAAEKTLATLEVPAHRALIEARIAATRGDLDAAAKSFEEGVRLWPDNPDARYLAGQVYERLGDWEHAAAHYREAARMERPHYESSLALADLQRSLGDEEGVSFLLLRLADAHPNDAKVIEKLIQYAGDTGSEELGMKMLTQLSRIPGQAGRAVALAAGRAELAQGAEAALKMVDDTRLDLLQPANIEAFEARTALLIGLDREDDALAAIEKAQVRDPKSVRLLVLRATVNRARGKLDQAIADLDAARKLDGQSLVAIFELASIQEEAGRPDVAARLYEEAVSIESGLAKRDQASEAKAKIALARLELATGKTDDARAHLRATLASNPRQGEAAWMLLKSYSDGESTGDLGEKERADLALRAAVFLHSPDAQDYYKKLTANKS